MTQSTLKVKSTKIDSYVSVGLAADSNAEAQLK
jgi:hypothetical protein